MLAPSGDLSDRRFYLSRDRSRFRREWVRQEYKEASLLSPLRRITVDGRENVAVSKNATLVDTKERRREGR